MLVWRLAAVMAVAAGVAHAQPSSPPRPAVITNPDWEEKPTGEQFAKYFPSGATTTGNVTISCAVTIEGRLIHCAVLDEYPMQENFGLAALKIAPFFKMKPKTIDGRPVAGGSVEVRIVFTYQGGLPGRWIHTPTEAELQSVWPQEAQGQPGEAEIVCRVTDKGVARNCRTVREDPAGKGFGAAAVKLAPRLALSPATYRGYAVPSDLQLVIVFALPASRQTGVAKYGEGRLALTNAPWRATPSRAEMAAAWPSQAPTDLAAGKAWLRCGFGADGGLASCGVFNEDPVDKGFGAAALSLAGRFRMREGAADPKALAEARITLAFTFTNPKLGSQAPAQITQYNWVTFIDPDRMTALYPDAAAVAGIKTGRGVVDCTVAADGSLTGCAIASEDPPGMGFGQAALAASASFTTNPWTDDGRPAEGARIHLPIRLVEAEDAPAPAPAAAPAATAPTPGKP